MATPYDFAERQCQLINSINKLVKPIQTQLNLMKTIRIQEQFCSPLDTTLRNIQKTFNDKITTEIYNFQNTMGSAINAQVCQPILELQAKLNTISENIANQQTSLNKIPQALNSKLNRLDSVIYKVNNIDIDKCSEETICINPDTIETINDFSNYIQDNIVNGIETASTDNRSKHKITDSNKVSVMTWIIFICTIIGTINSCYSIVSSNESAKKAEEYYNHATKVLDKIEYSLDQQNNKMPNKK